MMMLRKMTFLFVLLAVLLFWHASANAGMTFKQAKSSIDDSMKNIPKAAQVVYDMNFSTSEAKEYVISECHTTAGELIWKADFLGLLDGVAEDQYADYLKRIQACKPSYFEETYKGKGDNLKCFTCRPVAYVISAFLEGCSKSYPLMRSAGKTILLVLTSLWIAYHFLLSKIISFNEIDPMEYLQELFIFLFKVFIAYVCLSGGLSILMKYTMNPIISFGTGMALGFLGDLT